jgi:hypothetical protein
MGVVEFKPNLMRQNKQPQEKTMFRLLQHNGIMPILQA